MWGRLPKKEGLARRALLALILREGRDPGLKAIASRLQVSESATAKLLAALERKGFLVRSKPSKRITAAYPLSTRPTRHRVTLNGEGPGGYALCAIDALGVGPAFRATAIAQSDCPHCGRSIRIRVEKNRIMAVEPPSTVVWYSRPGLLLKGESNVSLVETH